MRKFSCKEKSCIKLNQVTFTSRWENYLWGVLRINQTSQSQSLSRTHQRIPLNTKHIHTHTYILIYMKLRREGGGFSNILYLTCYIFTNILLETDVKIQSEGFTLFSDGIRAEAEYNKGVESWQEEAARNN